MSSCLHGKNCDSFYTRSHLTCTCRDPWSSLFSSIAANRLLSAAERSRAPVISTGPAKQPMQARLIRGSKARNVKRVVDTTAHRRIRVSRVIHDVSNSHRAQVVRLSAERDDSPASQSSEHGELRGRLTRGEHVGRRSRRERLVIEGGLAMALRQGTQSAIRRER